MLSFSGTEGGGGIFKDIEKLIVTTTLSMYECNEYFNLLKTFDAKQLNNWFDRIFVPFSAFSKRHFGKFDEMKSQNKFHRRNFDGFVGHIFGKFVKNQPCCNLTKRSKSTTCFYCKFVSLFLLQSDVHTSLKYLNSFYLLLLQIQ